MPEPAHDDDDLGIETHAPVHRRDAPSSGGREMAWVPVAFLERLMMQAAAARAAQEAPPPPPPPKEREAPRSDPFAAGGGILVVDDSPGPGLRRVKVHGAPATHEPDPPVSSVLGGRS